MIGVHIVMISPKIYVDQDQTSHRGAILIENLYEVVYLHRIGSKMAIAERKLDVFDCHNIDYRLDEIC